LYYLFLLTPHSALEEKNPHHENDYCPSDQEKDISADGFHTDTPGDNGACSADSVGIGEQIGEGLHI